jgi:hypothetical protein
MMTLGKYSAWRSYEAFSATRQSDYFPAHAIFASASAGDLLPGWTGFQAGEKLVSLMTTLPLPM